MTTAAEANASAAVSMSMLEQRLNSPPACLVIVAALYALFIGAALRHSRDPSQFVQAGDACCSRSSTPSILYIRPHSSCYDGIYYFRLSLQPWTTRVTGVGITFDNPAYRQQRILYPLLVRLFSGGNVALIPWLLVVVNYLGLCWLGWLGGSYAGSRGQHALWGLIMPLYPGFLLTLTHDLSEIVEACFLIASLRLFQGRQYGGATLMLTLAILARETALLAAIGMLAAWVIAKGRQVINPPAPWYCFAVPLAVYGGWQFYLHHVWGDFPSQFSRKVTLGTPVVSLANAIHIMTARHDFSSLLFLAEIGLMLALSVAVLVLFRTAAIEPYIKLAWVLYAVLGLSLSSYVWSEDTNFLRGLTELYVLGALFVIGTADRVRTYVAAGSLTWWVFLSLNILRWR